MAKTRWIIKNSNENSKKSILDRLLEDRGIKKKKDKEEFLNPLTMDISSPMAFSDMEKAIGRISKSIENKEKILIYGDFDADGITSTSILLKTFNHLGANVDYFIPERDADGHGLNKSKLVKLLTQKIKLVITVDCGVSNVEEVAMLKSFKVDTIITDHHEAPEVLPEAYAIINPKAPNALSEDLSVKKIEHLTSLAGCGVAFKLAQALLIRYEKTDYLDNLLPYVALGTIADIVPLIGENRYFVQKGLDLISQGKHYGLKRLLENADCSLENINSEKIAFTVAPRINACGRLDDVNAALKILISENKQEIEMAIIEVNNFNKVRQDLCASTFDEACEMLGNSKEDAIILFNKNWHIGIIGIVASKMVEKYHKPTFLMTYSDETNSVRCSARSIKGIHLYETISAISDKLDGFGGHEMAAGLSFSYEKSSFEEVKKALLEVVSEASKNVDLTPIIEIDCELNSDDLNINLVEDISKLEPFGASNPSPVFCVKNATLKKKMLMGSEKNHLKLYIEKDGSEFQCVRWSLGDISLLEKDVLDLAFSPQINEYNGEISLQLLIKDIQSEYLNEEEVEVEGNLEINIQDDRKKKDILNLVDDYCKNPKADVVVFAENKTIIDTLQPYKTISSKIIKTDNLHQAKTLMFFDYPSDNETLNSIISEVNPKRIHFMEYLPAPIKFNEFINTIFGMIRFVCNNKDGIFEIENAKRFLGVNSITVLTTLEVLQEKGVIKIIDMSEKTCKVSALDGTNLKECLVDDLKSMLEDINKFRHKLANEENLEEFLKTLV